MERARKRRRNSWFPSASERLRAAEAGESSFGGPPAPMPWSRSRLRKYMIPAGRSKRNLAVIRRASVLRKRALPLQQCVICRRWTRLGRSWCWRWHCHPCWHNWGVDMNLAFVSECRQRWDRTFAAEGVSFVERGAALRRGARHCDFIEIGTSNYHTFAQAVADHPDGKPYAWNFLPWDRHPLRLRGLSVDVNRSYLDQLPELPRVTKVCAGISEHDGVRMVMHHMPLGDVQHWEAVFCCAWHRNWAPRYAACARLHRPQRAPHTSQLARAHRPAAPPAYAAHPHGGNRHAAPAL
eukprot:NODE_9780_length_1400_cov_4.349568.p1 GENE.NODE_9780_length_1400_cov_4.349568~~NODE_9780_length_1400_cov_4.349568.p1  ORF type:complete len:295 (-),score=62.54 NODE_9780_length_1400_cov_4.349568:392-1276(-)